MAKINHCGKSFDADNRYVVTNYPGNGDITYFDKVKCEICTNNVHLYWTHYFRAKSPTPKVQSDKHDRGKYDDLIRQGKAFIIPKHQDEIPKDTKAQVLAGEFTLEMMHSADVTAAYLSLNDKAPWVSTKSVSLLEDKRAEWLRELQKRKYY